LSPGYAAAAAAARYDDTWLPWQRRQQQQQQQPYTLIHLCAGGMLVMRGLFVYSDIN